MVTTWEHAKLEIQKFIEIRITLILQAGQVCSNVCGRTAGAGPQDRGGVQQADDQGVPGHGTGEVPTEGPEGS